MVAIFSECASFACSSTASVMSVITTTTLFTWFDSSRMGLRLMEKWPMEPSLRLTRNSRFSTCWPCAVVCSAASKSLRCEVSTQPHEPLADHFFFAIARFDSNAGSRS